MHKSKRTKTVLALVTAFALLAGPLSITNANAGMAMNDKAILKAKQKLIQAMIDGTEAAVQKQIDLDKAAATSEDCVSLSEKSRDTALKTTAAKKVSDPGKIIQNSTCFVDVAHVDIPIQVVSTGIGFIDGIIKAELQKFLTSACTASTGFLGDLTNVANAVFDGADLDTLGGMVFDYAAKELPTADALATQATQVLQQQLQASANTYITSLVNQAAGSIKPVGTTLPPELQTQFNTIVKNAGSTLTSNAITTAQMYITTQVQMDAFQCALGQANATCP